MKRQAAEFSFCIPFQDPDGVQQKESVASPAHPCVRTTRVVSSTSEEEEAFTEKFLKINCKYITNGKVLNIHVLHLLYGM